MSLAVLAAAAALALGPQPPNAPLVFADSAHGWLGTPTGILGTSNGGRSWQKQSALGGEALEAVDARHAWAIAGQGQFLRTVNGRSWENLGVKHLAALSFVGAAQGFALERDGILLRTADGGRTWPAVPRAPLAQSLCFADPAHGWLAQGGTVFSTSDSGGTWRRVALRPSRQGYPIPALGCRDSGVWIVFHEGAGAGTEGYEVYRSLDGGRSWREVLATPWQRKLPHISNYAGPFSVLAGGGAVLAGTCSPCRARGTTTVLQTADGGRTFVRRTFAGANLRALAFTDPGHGWLLLDGRVRRIR